MRRRGMSLVEIVVAMTVFALLGTLLMQVLLPTLSAWQGEQGRNASVEAACALESRIVADLQQASASSVSILPTGPRPGFSMLQPGPGPVCDPATGVPMWGTLVIWWLDPATGTVWRKMWPGSAGDVPPPPVTLPTTSAAPLDATTLAALMGTPAQAQRQMGSGITALFLTPGSGRLVTLDLSAPAGSRHVVVRMGR